MAAVEGGVEGGDKDGSDSAGAGGALQGSFFRCCCYMGAMYGW